MTAVLSPDEMDTVSCDPEATPRKRCSLEYAQRQLRGNRLMCEHILHARVYYLHREILAIKFPGLSLDIGSGVSIGSF